MKALVTGAKGFVGKNLCAELNNLNIEILEYDLDSDADLLKGYCKEADIIFHLAGVNRPKNSEEFESGNAGFTKELCSCLKEASSKAPIIMPSSVQAALDNDYGRSKLAAEEAVFAYAKDAGVMAYIFRFPNIFGKWSKPDYNSAVATFCHNIARGKEIKINDPDAKIKLIYIDDIVKSFVRIMNGEEPALMDKEGFREMAVNATDEDIKRTWNEDALYCKPEPVYLTTVGRLAEMIYSFRSSREDLLLPDISDALVKKLYSTYTSFLPDDDFSYTLKMNEDERGSFTEVLKSADRGQVSVNIIRPGVTKGNHWHHTKVEKFVVISGKGIITFRKIGEDKITEYEVSEEEIRVVDIPAGYTHNIKNTGDGNMVVLMWANEVFDPDRSDTYYEDV